MSSEQEPILVSARKSRALDPWNKDDYEVRLGDIAGPVVGRIFKSTVAPPDSPWFWTIIKSQKPTHRGYASTREMALYALKEALRLTSAFRPE
jgi:hypothetical protein